jgi:hypothetical protein
MDGGNWDGNAALSDALNVTLTAGAFAAGSAIVFTVTNIKEPLSSSVRPQPHCRRCDHQRHVADRARL